MDPEGRLDATDWQLLEELQKNARVSYTELGRRVGLTAPAVIERVRRMEETGVITGYRTELNLDRIGRPVKAVIRFAANSLRCAEVRAVISEVPGLLQWDRVTGDDCYVMKVAVSSMEELESLLNRLAPFGKTVTSMVLSSSVCPRYGGLCEGESRAEHGRPVRNS